VRNTNPTSLNIYFHGRFSSAEGRRAAALGGLETPFGQQQSQIQCLLKGIFSQQRIRQDLAEYISSTR